MQSSSVISYPLAIVNVFVAGALIHLYLHRAECNWNPPIKASLPVPILVRLSYIYLVLASVIPPSEDNSLYAKLPYWPHGAAAFASSAAAGVYWLGWAVILPKIAGYRMERAVTIDDIDGWERSVFKH